jgi:putative ABC transport system substrate-binding protein
VAWPVVARAQQQKMPIVGFLSVGSPDTQSRNVAAFRQGLKETGYIEGQNVAIEYRWAGTEYHRLPALAADLVSRQVAVIATGPRAGAAAKSVTATVPIVFVNGADPVRMSLVSNVNRPGGNLTGFTILGPDLSVKRFGLLHDSVPQAAVIGVLLDETGPAEENRLTQSQLQALSQGIGVSVHVEHVGSELDFDASFATIVRAGAGALFVGAGTYFGAFRARLIALAAQYHVPANYQGRAYVEAGGLMSYGPSDDAFRQQGIYVGRSLKGENPGDLPVQFPTKYELIINLKTAKALGLSIPETLLATADEIIQ